MLCSDTKSKQYREQNDNIYNTRVGNWSASVCERYTGSWGQESSGRSNQEHKEYGWKKGSLGLVIRSHNI